MAHIFFLRPARQQRTRHMRMERRRRMLRAPSSWAKRRGEGGRGGKNFAPLFLLRLLLIHRLLLSTQHILGPFLPPSAHSRPQTSQPARPQPKELSPRGEEPPPPLSFPSLPGSSSSSSAHTHFPFPPRIKKRGTKRGRAPPLALSLSTSSDAQGEKGGGDLFCVFSAEKALFIARMLC